MFADEAVERLCRLPCGKAGPFRFDATQIEAAPPVVSDPLVGAR